MAGEPALKVFVDTGRTGSFAAGDDVTQYLASASGVQWDRGRSADFGSDAQGSASFVLMNTGGRFNSLLAPGQPVHIRSNYLGVDRAHFYGFVQTVAPDPWGYTVAVACLDPMRRMAEVGAIVPAVPNLSRSVRETRIAVLEDFERGTLNLLPNPSFETDTAGWTATGAALTRVNDAPAAGGSWCGSLAAAAGPVSAQALVAMAPATYKDEIYRFSVWLRATSGAPQAAIALTDTNMVTLLGQVTCQLSTTWALFTTAVKLPASASASGSSAVLGAQAALVVQVSTVSNAVVRIDAAMVTRGAEAHAFASPGAGRWGNLVGNGGFDGGSAAGWLNAYKNVCANPSFESNATGWAAVARDTTNHKFGSADGVATGAQSPTYNLTGTFLSGVAYGFSCWLLGTGGTISIDLHSIGTPADVSTVSCGAPLAWTRFSGTWTPSSNRSDAQFKVTNTGGSQLFVDGVAVVRLGSDGNIPQYSDTGPGPAGGSFATSLSTGAALAKWGSSSLAVATPATAGAGVIYDFHQLGPYFVKGVQYAFSVWINPTSSMAYRCGVSRNKGDGTWEDAGASGTAAANQWTQVTWTWTPASDASCAAAGDVVLYAWQTDSTARTFSLDGVRATPGSSADAFEMAQWSLAQESDVLLQTVSVAGPALAALDALNGISLTRHYVKPSMSSPWYQYATSARGDLAGKASQETYSDDFRGWEQGDLDRDSIANVVTITWYDNVGGGAEQVSYYSDPASVDTYGAHPGGDIDGSKFYPNRSVPDAVGAALILRYSTPRGRPVMEVRERFPSMLARELDDLVTVSLTRLGISAKKYLIVKAATAVDMSGAIWTSKYTLEEHAF